MITKIPSSMKRTISRTWSLCLGLRHQNSSNVARRPLTISMLTVGYHLLHSAFVALQNKADQCARKGNGKELCHCLGRVITRLLLLHFRGQTRHASLTTCSHSFGGCLRSVWMLQWRIIIRGRLAQRDYRIVIWTSDDLCGSRRSVAHGVA